MGKWTALDELIERKRQQMNEQEAQMSKQRYTNDRLTKDELTEMGQLGQRIVKSSSRICFGIEFFANESDADRFGELIWKRGDTYNGGWMHGMPCGRDKTWDHEDKATGRTMYAVTTR